MAWVEIKEQTGVFLLEPQAEGHLNCIAIQTMDGIIILNPSNEISDEDFRWIQQEDLVFALIALDTRNYLGLKNWQARLPEALLFAPKKYLPEWISQGFENIKSLDTLRLPNKDISLICTKEINSNDLLIIVERNAELVMYTENIIQFKNANERLQRKILDALQSATAIALAQGKISRSVPEVTQARSLLKIKNHP